MTELPRLAEADGVFFLTLAKGDRTSIAYTIERLIDMLDMMDGDPDDEITLEDDEDSQDDEPSIGVCTYAGFGRYETDLELDRCDDEENGDLEPEETDCDLAGAGTDVEGDPGEYDAPIFIWGGAEDGREARA